LRPESTLARRQDTLTAAASAAQPFHESGNGGARNTLLGTRWGANREAALTSPHRRAPLSVLKAPASPGRGFSFAWQGLVPA
jgi:hypothetical protein